MKAGFGGELTMVGDSAAEGKGTSSRRIDLAIKMQTLNYWI